MGVETRLDSKNVAGGLKMLSWSSKNVDVGSKRSGGVVGSVGVVVTGVGPSL